MTDELKRTLLVLVFLTISGWSAFAYVAIRRKAGRPKSTLTIGNHSDGPATTVCKQVWDGAASTEDCWSFQMKPDDK